LVLSEAIMSTAVLEPIIKQPVVAGPATLAAAAPAPVVIEEEKWSDPHPLVPVFIAGAISLVLSITSMGAFLMWLAVRHSGVVAP
jgi:hypothetical protein